MMHHMKMRDIMHKEAPLPPEEIAVDRCSRAARKRPRLPTVVRRGGVGVVQERHEDDPMAEAKPRGPEVLERDVGRERGKENKGAQDTEVGENDEVALGGPEEGGVGCVRLFSGLWRVSAASERTVVVAGACGVVLSTGKVQD